VKTLNSHKSNQNTTQQVKWLKTLLSFNMADEVIAEGDMALGNLLRRDRAAFNELVRDAGRAVPAPGYMEREEALRYLSQIYGLFPGADRGKVEAVLCQWCIKHDTGGTQDYSGKPTINVGNFRVAATEVFGKVIPTDNRGYPRRFAAALFEEHVPAMLEADPELRAALTPRALAAGLQRGQEVLVVPFMRGGKVGTQATTAARYMVKERSMRVAGSGEPLPLPVQEVGRGGDGAVVDAPYHGLF